MRARKNRALWLGRGRGRINQNGLAGHRMREVGAESTSCNLHRE